MCYAIPGKIIKIMNDNATIDYDGVTKVANISLVENPKLGDYVLVHAGFAIEILNKKNAEESINAIKNQIKITDGLEK